MAEAESHGGRSVTRQEFEHEVVERARKDRAFRQHLLTSPNDALKTAFGVELPPGVEIQVLQETVSRFYMVLPVEVEELSGEQLAAVAGGAGSQASAATACGAPGGLDRSGLLWNPSATFRLK
jgi:hypothetical protein